MKPYPLFLALAILFCLFFSSCKRYESTNSRYDEDCMFSYSDDDLSANNHIITFRASIQNLANQTLWDSVLTPIRISEIPDKDHRIKFEKQVPGNDPSLLKVGFYYSIENVGNSWYLDSFKVGQTTKSLEFNFH